MDFWCDPSAWLIFISMFAAAGFGGGLMGLVAFFWLMTRVPKNGRWP